MTTKCKFRNSSATCCNANAQATNGLCVFQDPTRTADGRRARREGGWQRSRPASVFPLEVPDASLKNSLDVSSLLAESINAVREGRLDPRVSNAIGCLAGILLRALEQGPTEERLARLETILELAGNSQTGKLWIESLQLAPKSKAHISRHDSIAVGVRHVVGHYSGAEKPDGTCHSQKRNQAIAQTA